MRFNEEDEEKYLKLINNTRRGSSKDFEVIGRSFADCGNDIILAALNWQIGNRKPVL